MEGGGEAMWRKEVGSCGGCTNVVEEGDAVHDSS